MPPLRLLFWGMPDMEIQGWLEVGWGRGKRKEVDCTKNPENARLVFKNWYSHGGVLSKHEEGYKQTAQEH